MTKILFLLALSLCVAGIVAGSITASWLPIPLTLLGMGIALIIIYLAILSKKQKRFWDRRATQEGANALITTTAILVIIGLINFLAIRHGERWDLTENQLFTLSPQSQAIAQNLEQPLTVWIFDRNINYEIETLLKNYARYGKNFQFNFIDPEIEVALAQQFRVQALGEIYLQYGDKKQRLELPNNIPGETISEPQLTNAILKIQRDRSDTIYFLQGHGEPDLTEVERGIYQAVKNLEDRGYIVKSLNLASRDKIPENAKIIAIVGAVRKLFPAEVKSLQQYLNNGGNILLMLPPQSEIGINSLLQDWGIELDNRLILDGSGAASIIGLGPAALIIDSYGEHPITKSFRNGISIFPESRHLKITTKEGINSVPLVITNEETWAESNLTNEEIAFDPQEDIPGPLNIAIALERNQEKTESRLIIFGSYTFITNGWFEEQLNGDIFLNSISWLARENAETLSIRPKEQTNRRINLSPLQAGIINWMAIVIMPLLSLITAGILWWRRR